MAIIELTGDNFESVVEANPFICIDFWASWCAPCKSFKEIFKLVAEQYPDVAFASCDIEVNEDLAEEFAIQSVPHVMILRDQVAVYDESGLLDKASFADLIEQAKALDMQALKAQMDEEG
jgi:thioredoxin